MSNRHAPARAFPLFAIASMLFAGLPALPLLAGTAQAGAALFEEGWEPGAAPWTYSPGLRIGPDAQAYSGVGSLVVDPQVSGQTLSAEKHLGLSFASQPGYVVSFVFRNEFAHSKSSSWFTMNFAGGGHVRLDPTHGDPRNQVRLYTNSAATAPLTTPSNQVFTYADDTWYMGVIKMDLLNGKVRAEVRNPTTGALLASSTLLNAPTNAGSVGLVSFQGLYTGNDPIQQPPVPMNYDVLQFRLPDPPTAPSPLTATAGPGVGEIRLTWQTPSDDGGVPVLYYHVFRADASGGATTLVANTTSRTWTDTGLGNGVTRFYHVKAINAVNASAPSNEASAKTFDFPTAPQSFTAAAGSNVGQVRLTWTPPVNTGGTPITGYKVYRGESSGSATFLAQLAGGVTSYTDSHRPNGTRWYYNLTAVNLVGEGPTSPERSSLPKPDQAFPATGITISPSTGWTGDARTANFTYNVAVSQCAPTETCPIAHEWRVYQDGTPGGLDGVLLASGTNTHAGHAETTSFPVSTTITPTGADGTHLLKVAVNARTGSTQWAIAGAGFQLDAPVPGQLTGPTAPVLNRSTATVGMPIHVNASYDVFQKQCRPTDTCPVTNEWMILFDGTLPNSPDGTLLASGNFSHPAHGTTQTYAISQSVTVPHTGLGPHYVKVAARADAGSSWQVSAALLSVTPTDSGVLLFQPDLDNTTYVLTNGTMAYEVENHGVPVWTHGEIRTGPLSAHTGRHAWGINLQGAYPALANGSLTLRDLDLRTAGSAGLSFWTWYATEAGVDGTRALVQLDGTGPKVPIEPAGGPSYVTLRDGTRAWSGYTQGWQQASLDLTPYIGHVVSVSFEFRSDALENPPGGWFLDDLQLLVNGTLTLQDDFEGAWRPSGTWELLRPTTGPGSGHTSNNAWNIAPAAPYAGGARSTLELPRVNLTDDRATLTFWQWLKTEHMHDLAYLEISEDKGTSWRLIEPFLGPAYEELAPGKRGWSGNSLGWTQSTFDLAPFAGGRELHLRLVFESDSTINDAGWYVSDFKIQAVRPGLAPSTSFAERTNQTGAFYAYFDHGGTNATLTTPSGKTITLRYTGTTNDVVARLAADGTVTARRAIVGPFGPTAVPASNFVVTGGNFLEERTSGTWEIRPAPGALSGTWGGTRLEVGGKVFDDVAASPNEPIEGNGLGRLSSANRVLLTWNWHNQQNARYDTGLSSQANPEETALDVRRFYDIDTDGDGASDKEELNKNSDPASPTSSPTTDDDADGIVNMLEQSRPAALSAALNAANDLVNMAFGEDWERMRYHHIFTAETKDDTRPDYDQDGIPDFADMENHASQALVTVDSNPVSNRVQLATTLTSNQVAVLISPDWKNVLLVRINSGQADTSTTAPISYEQFFQEIDGYAQANGMDDMVKRTLRQVLDSGMSFHLTRKSGTEWTISLAAMNGAPADGTWTLMRDVGIPDFTLTVGGITLSAQHPVVGAVPALGTARVSWAFLDLHRGTTQCVSVNILYRLSPCGSLPSTLGMRFYGSSAHGNAEGLIARLREEYRTAGLLPMVHQTAFQPPGTAPLSAGRWGPTPEGLSVPAATSLTLPEGVLASADADRQEPRLFSWTYRYHAPDDRFTGEPSLTLVLEPLDSDHTGSNVILHGSVLQALGFNTSRNLTVQLDPGHVNGSSITRSDADGDGIMDYRVWVPHFSAAWISVATSMSAATDIGLVSTTNGFAAAAGRGMWVYASSGSPAWKNVANNPTVSGHGLYAVDPLSSTEAWFAGGCVENNFGSQGKDLVIRLYNSGGSWQQDVHNPSGMGGDGQTCPGHFFSVRAFSSSLVFAAGEHGVWRWNGANWQKVLDKRIDGMQFTSSTNGFALERVNTSYSNLWRWNGASWTNQGAFRGGITYTTVADGMTRTKDNTMVWDQVRGSGGMTYVNAYNTACNCWQTRDIPSDGSNYDGVSIVGINNNEAWSAGSTNTVNAAIRHYTGANWIPVSSSEGDFSSSMSFYAMDFANRQDGWASANDAIYHYTGSNSAPGLAYSLNPAGGDTTTTFNGDATQTVDVDGDAFTITWNWGDGTAQNTGTLVSHRYRDAGTYTLTVTATDSKGASTTKTRQVTVGHYTLQNNVDLVQSFSATGQQDYYTFNVPSGSAMFRLTLTGPGGTNFDVYARRDAKPTTAVFDVAGRSGTSGEDVQLPSPPAGLYYVMVRSQSGVGSYTLRASFDGPPTAPTLTVDPANPVWYVAFTLSGVSQSSKQIYYRIEWGDGSPDTNYPTSGTVSGGTPFSLTHTYTGVFTYVVRVTATDTNGLSTSSTIAVRVVEPPPQPPTCGAQLPEGHVANVENVSHFAVRFRGRITSLGGTCNINAWFEYGLHGQGYPHGNIGGATRGLGDHTYEWLTFHPGVTYQVRLVLQNAAGTYRSDAFVWTQNSPPLRQDVPLGNREAVEGDPYEWNVNYVDADGQGNRGVSVAVAMGPDPWGNRRENDLWLGMDTNAGPCPDYCEGALYSKRYNQLPAGWYKYYYYACDTTPGGDFCMDDWEIQGGSGGVTVRPASPVYYDMHILRKVHYEDPITYDPAGSDLPSSAWTRTMPEGLGPYWHVVNVMDHQPGIGPHPRSSTDPYALWFGRNDTRTYESGSDPVRGSVVTPLVDLADGTHHAVRFYSWFQTDDRVWADAKRVYVQPELGAERMILNLTGPHQGARGWVPISASLNDWAGQRVRLRFEFDTVDEVQNDRKGWFIDDLLIGRDQDGDGVPDKAEEKDKITLNRRTWPRSVTIPAGQTQSVMLRGIQQSFTDAASLSFTVTPYQGSTIVLNNSAWSTTVYSGGLGPGAIMLGSGHFIVNLSNAGLNLKTLDKGDNFTLRVTAPGSSVQVLSVLMRVTGRTSPLTSDSDGDGLGDGAEWTLLGSNPLSGDADNDGFYDMVDVRPMTPDQPPVISEIQGLNGVWSSGLEFTVTATESDIASVQLVTTDTLGQTYNWPVAWSDGTRWKFDWSQYFINHAKAEVTATDSRGDISTVLLEYTANRPSSIWNGYDAQTTAGPQMAPLVVPIAKQAVKTTVQTTEKEILKVIVYQSVEVGAVGAAAANTMTLVGIVMIMPIAGGGSHQVVLEQPKVMHGTPMVAQYNVQQLQQAHKGCLQELFLLEGTDVGPARRGAKGIASEFPRYPNAQSVAQHIQSVLGNSQARLTQTTPQSAALLNFNTGLGVIERWDIHLLYDLPDLTKCRGEIVRQQDLIGYDVQQQAQLAQQVGGKYHGYLRPHPKTEEERRTARVAIIDGDTKLLAGPLVEVQIPDEVMERVYQAAEHATTPAGLLTSVQMQFAIMVYQTAVETNGQALLPNWYWGSASDGRRTASPTSSFPNEETFLLDDDAAGRDDYNDLGSAGEESIGTVLGSFVNRDIAASLASAERAICKRLDVDSTPRKAYVPMAMLQKDASVMLIMEVLKSPDQMVVTGRCDC